MNAPLRTDGDATVVIEHDEVHEHVNVEPDSVQRVLGSVRRQGNTLGSDLDIIILKGVDSCDAHVAEHGPS